MHLATNTWKPAAALLLAALAVILAGCGHTEQEWQAQMDKYRRLLSKQQSTEKNMQQLSSELQEAKLRVQQLEDDLKKAGVDLGKLHTDLESRGTEISSLSARLDERQNALAEYKQRAERLEKIKQRFETLKTKLDALTSVGLDVSIRRNRMIISLPGDVLFPSGKDTLKKDGENILSRLSAIINADASLRAREYQVAGHTDNQVLRGGGLFRDNWGLSLMRARQVLLYLIDIDKGGLPKERWSAAGFGDTDPIATNDTPEGRAKNRRCEIIVVPSAEEMLDIRNIIK